MENSAVFHTLKSDLISLGFSFYGNPSLRSADPEVTLIRALEFFYEDRKVFRMLLRWCLVTSPLLHVERLYKWSENLEPRLVPILGALSKKLIQSGDRRFKLIYEEMKKRMKQRKIRIATPEGYSDSFLVSKYGADEEFGEFGVTIARLEPEDERKVLNLPGIIKTHRWLRLRTLVGANFRADLIYWLTEKTLENPNQAAKVLGCSRETAYRLWKEVSLYQDFDKLVA